ncbi:UNVERIFIED_CONTAM: hypothetical protein ABID98_004141 [Brevibacillus sp. OAP136]
MARERGLHDEKLLSADLVIDASGRSSKLSAWLEEMGYAVPQPDMLQANIGYSTRRYRVPARSAHLEETWDVINIAGQPTNGTFTGVFSFLENHVAEMLLYRPGGQYPPTDAGQFEQTVAALPSQLIADMLQQLEPLSPPKGFRMPHSYRQRYEQMERWPSGLLVLGDAYCTFDPIFGQGMTVAALQTELLELSLRDDRDEHTLQFERTALRRMQEAIAPAWWLNCATDLQWEGVEYAGSEPLKGIAFGKRYMDLFLKHATTEQSWALYGLYWAVNSLSVPPRALFAPDLVKTILSASEEGQRLLAQLIQEHGKPLEDILTDILPVFSEAPYQQSQQYVAP